MLFSALRTSSYLNLNPSAFALLGTTFCPSSTTTAPSPSRAVNANAGTGSHEGLPSACPSADEKSLIRTGCGAVPLIGPS